MSPTHLRIKTLMLVILVAALALGAFAFVRRLFTAEATAERVVRLEAAP